MSILATFILKYELTGKAGRRPDIFRVVLCPCAEFYPCEASEQKWGKTLKSKPKELAARALVQIFLAPFLPKVWRKFGRNGFKNPSPLVSQEFSPLTAAKKFE